MYKLIRIDDVDPALFDGDASVDQGSSIRQVQGSEQEILSELNGVASSPGDLKQYVYVSTSDSDHGTYIFEDSCLVEDLEHLIMDILSIYGEEYNFLCLPEYVALYVDEDGNAVHIEE